MKSNWNGAKNFKVEKEKGRRYMVIHISCG